MNTNEVISLIASIREHANSMIIDELESRGHPGLAPSHGSILYNLYKLGPQPMSALAKAIGRKKNTVTVLVKKMECAGYVGREQHPTDSRVTLIHLTSKGESFRKDFEEVSTKVLDVVWAGVEPEEQRMMVGGLKKLLSNLQ